MIWHCAGIVGVHPGEFTLRELLLMSEGRAKLEWAQTSELIAMTGNAPHFKPRSKSGYNPANFNPYADPERRMVKPKGVKLRQANIDLLKIFLPRNHSEAGNGE